MTVTKKTTKLTKKQESEYRKIKLEEIERMTSDLDNYLDFVFNKVEIIRDKHNKIALELHHLYNSKKWTHAAVCEKIREHKEREDFLVDPERITSNVSFRSFAGPLQKTINLETKRKSK